MVTSNVGPAIVGSDLANFVETYTSVEYGIPLDPGSVGIAVNVTGISIGAPGNGASNYTLNGVNTASTTANISPRMVYIDAMPATKTYDSTTSTSVAPTVALPTGTTGLVSPDTVLPERYLPVPNRSWFPRMS